MTVDEYHQSLRPLEKACGLAGTEWVCIPNPLVGWGCEGTVVWKFRILLRHITLVFRCWRNASHAHILIREFSTLPLLLVFPFLWPFRQRLFFVIHHNLQWVVRSTLERAGLFVLTRLGARWTLFETEELEGLSAFNIPSEQNLVLPHPVPEQSAQGIQTDLPVIGVVGYYRPEKGMEELLRLLADHFPDCQMVLGVPNPEELNGVPDGIRVVNTAADADYRQLLIECDVLVQNGAADRYRYRVSGPLADAAACGTAIVAPDFPLIRHQLLSPVPVGEVFESPGAMPDSVRLAIENVRAGHYDFNTYCAARSANALANHLDEFSNGKS